MALGVYLQMSIIKTNRTLLLLFIYLLQYLIPYNVIYITRNKKGTVHFLLRRVWQGHQPPKKTKTSTLNAATILQIAHQIFICFTNTQRRL